MSSPKDSAAAAKAKGNAAFSAGNFQEAVKHFTEAIGGDPSDPIFYSNRSGAYASLKQYREALEDAEKCISLKPDFVKGYSRKGLALYSLGKYSEAKAAYEKGLQLDKDNVQCKEGIQEVNKALNPSSNTNVNPFASMFGPDMWGKLTADPITREHLKDQDFVSKMQAIQRDPSGFGNYAKDEKVSQALGVLFGLGANAFAAARRAGGGDDDTRMEDDEDEEEEYKDDHTGYDHRNHPHPQRSHHTSSSSAKQPPTSPKELTEEEKKRQAADVEKELGNTAFKNRQFDAAIEHYTKATEIDPSNMIYHNNLSACYFEQKNYDACIEAAKKAIEIGKEHMANYKDIAKSLFRIGNAYVAQKNWNAAIEAYEKSQIEDYQEKTKQALKKVTSIKQKEEAESYLNPELSEEAKAKGNQCYNEGKWKEAIDYYSEALKRNPKNYKVYSNRAACYSKLMDWQRGLDDCDACLAQDPAFVKAYIRKGKIQHFLKQYHKALETFEQGLKIDPNSTELIEGRRLTYQAINSGEADPDRAKEAMKDPEIQQILRDPTINKVLSELQADPSAAKAALNNKEIRTKIEKLIAAGIISVK